MNPVVIPYSTKVFPTIQKLIDVLDREKTQVDKLLKHENFTDFLQRFDKTLDFYFEAEKLDFDAKTVDCTIIDWEQCANKIAKLFENIDFEQTQFEKFNSKIRGKFYLRGMKYYSHCYKSPQIRLYDIIKKENFKYLPSLLQQMLYYLKVEVECCDAFPEWITRTESIAKEQIIIRRNVNILQNDPEFFMRNV